jgi:hypothetical protein
MKQTKSIPLYLTTFLSLVVIALLFLQVEESNNSIPSSATSFFHRILNSTPHKPLFPLDFTDIVGTILVSVALLIAASGGIGGGGILVPLFILVFQFGPKHAVALSNFCILATSVTNMVINLPKRHPFANRPLVDWDLILVMEPLTMGGAVSDISFFLSLFLYFFLSLFIFLLLNRFWVR